LGAKPKIAAIIMMTTTIVRDNNSGYTSFKIIGIIIMIPNATLNMRLFLKFFMILSNSAGVVFMMFCDSDIAGLILLDNKYI
jgi:hypothetical protein